MPLATLLAALLAALLAQPCAGADLPPADPPTVAPDVAPDDPKADSPAVAPEPLPGASGSGMGETPTVEPADEGSEVVTSPFMLPPSTSVRGSPPRPLIQRLNYQFSWGSESDAVYQANYDLDKSTPDDTVRLVPQLNALLTWRPADRLESVFELIVEREIVAKEPPSTLLLPSGERRPVERRQSTVVADQAYVNLKLAEDHGELSVGRRNFEDDRHWIYDTSLDAVMGRLRADLFRFDAVVARKDLWDLDLTKSIPRERIETWFLNAEYRGIEDHKLAAWRIERRDRNGVEGRPVQTGLRVIGRPRDGFNYWADVAFLSGVDGSNQEFSARAYDFGGTWQFTGPPWLWSGTLGWASATGDRVAGDGRNEEFRQTGLHSNEGRMAGIPKFKYYGEVFDPDLSNLRILTAAVGFRPAPAVSVDLVYHRYWLNQIADTNRGTPIVAQMNQDDTQLSRAVGAEIDAVIGLRNLFGVRRLGLDIRAGLFLPGKAYRIEQAGPRNTSTFRRAERGFSLFVKFWW